MTDLSSGANPFDPFGWFSPRAGGIAIGGLTQPILPGWSFGNLVVNEQNSSSPATEGRIVSEESYGRQIGKLLDAVLVLIEVQGGPGEVKAYQELEALHRRVEAIKTRAAADRLGQVRRDLERLRLSDPAAYRDEVAALKRLLAS